MKELLELNKYIDVYYLVSFMLIASITKDTLHSAIVYVFNKRFKKQYLSVFIIGTIVAVPFWLNLFDTEPTKIQLFMTYCLGTVFHSHFFKQISNLIKKPTKNDNQ